MTKTAVQKKPEIQSVKNFYLKLNAPLILYSEKAMYTTDAKELVKELSAALWQNENILENSVESRYIKTTFVGGYNVTWGLRKPTVGAFDKGTVIQFKQKMQWTYRWVQSGLESVTQKDTVNVNWQFARKVRTMASMYRKRCQQSKVRIQPGKLRFVQNCSARLPAIYLMNICMPMPHTRQKTMKKNTAAKATVSNMQIMCSENDSLEKVKNICEERYNKASDEKKKKLEQAKKICETVERDSKDIKDKFMEQYHMSDFEYRNDKI